MTTERDETNGGAWVVMGVSGCGKSSIGARLAQALGLPFIEGDAFHSSANVAKMAAGTPLTDDDRRDWLATLRDELARHLRQGGAVLACSSLKRAYRDVLREADAGLRFVHLSGPRDVLLERMGKRPGHYMPASLLDSQLQTLEALQADERGIVLDIREAPQRMVERVLEWAGK